MVLLRKEGKWVSPSVQNYDDEAAFRDLLADSPELIPGCAGALTVTEFPISPSHYLDVLCVDETGSLTLVECKLHKNSEIRRSIVGQIFAYASGLDGMSYDEFSAKFSSRTQQDLATSVQQRFGAVDVDRFRGELEASLREGRFRLVLAVDEITDELKTIVEYLNNHLHDTLALVLLELGLIRVDEAAEILVPSTFGAEIAEQRAQSGSQHRWAREEVEQAANRLPEGPGKSLVLDLLQHQLASGAAFQGGTGAAPSAGVYHAVGGDRRSVFSVYIKEAGPTVTVNLGSIRLASELAAQAALEALKAVPTAAALLDDDDVMLGKYPGFEVNDPELARAVRAAINAVIGDIPRTTG